MYLEVQQLIRTIAKLQHSKHVAARFQKFEIVYAINSLKPLRLATFSIQFVDNDNRLEHNDILFSNEELHKV
jgi:hypothetical protein